jgi:hypothetical protein
MGFGDRMTALEKTRAADLAVIDTLLLIRFKRSLGKRKRWWRKAIRQELNRRGL